jgi:hypothetical protein
MCIQNETSLAATLLRPRGRPNALGQLKGGWNYDRRAHVLPPAQKTESKFVNDPSAGSPTETLLRLLLPLNDQV